MFFSALSNWFFLSFLPLIMYAVLDISSLPTPFVGYVGLTLPDTDGNHDFCLSETATQIALVAAISFALSNSLCHQWLLIISLGEASPGHVFLAATCAHLCTLNSKLHLWKQRKRNSPLLRWLPLLVVTKDKKVSKQTAKPAKTDCSFCYVSSNHF